MLLALAAGLAAGIVHTLSGPDHMVALTTLATTTTRGRAWGLGLRWGLGHAASSSLLVLMAFALQQSLPLAWLSCWGERLVGLTLIVLGLWALRRSLLGSLHVHEHEHDGPRHTHLHLHRRYRPIPRPGGEQSPHAHTHAAAAVGALHGMAGASHLSGVLFVLAFPSLPLVLGYLAAFAAGSIGAMMAFCHAIDAMAAHLGRGPAGRLHRQMVPIAASLSIALGIFWLTL